MRVSAIVHSTEDPMKVIQAIGNITRSNGYSEPGVSRAKGHYGNPITTLVLGIKNPLVAENCLRDVWGRLIALDKEKVVTSLVSRVDASGTLYLRIDKQQALRGAVRLQDADPIKLAVSFKAFGPKHDQVFTEIQKVLTEFSADVRESS